MLTASVAALPIFAKLLVDDRAEDMPPAIARSRLEIVVGDVVNRADADNRRLQEIRRAAQGEAFGKRSEKLSPDQFNPLLENAGFAQPMVTPRLVEDSTVVSTVA